MAAKNISDNTGTGGDRKGAKRDGLRFSWKWLRQCQLSQAPERDKRRLPCQTCFAEITTKVGTVRFESIDWHSEYEAAVEIDHRLQLSEKGFLTRIDAQKQAERMAQDFCAALLSELPGEKE